MLFCFSPQILFIVNFHSLVGFVSKLKFVGFQTCNDVVAHSLQPEIRYISLLRVYFLEWLHPRRQFLPLKAKKAKCKEIELSLHV